MSFAKILIEGKIESVTGLHIGGAGVYSAIGAVDSPVIRDSVSGEPIIPGSSLKGKMRALLQKTFFASASHDKDHQEVLRLFGSSGGRSEGLIPAKLKFSDCFLNEDKVKMLMAANIRLTEVKTENTIDRQTSVANPRQIERSIRGLIFDFELIYDVLDNDRKVLEDDFKNIILSMELLEADYLGGHGSRGSGRVKFTDLSASLLYGDVKLDFFDNLGARIKFSGQKQEHKRVNGN